MKSGAEKGGFERGPAAPVQRARKMPKTQAEPFGNYERRASEDYETMQKSRLQRIMRVYNTPEGAKADAKYWELMDGDRGGFTPYLRGEIESYIEGIRDNAPAAEVQELEEAVAPWLENLQQLENARIKLTNLQPYDTERYAVERELESFLVNFEVDFAQHDRRVAAIVARAQQERFGSMNVLFSYRANQFKAQMREALIGMGEKGQDVDNLLAFMERMTAADQARRDVSSPFGVLINLVYPKKREELNETESLLVDASVSATMALRTTLDIGGNVEDEGRYLFGEAPDLPPYDPGMDDSPFQRPMSGEPIDGEEEEEEEENFEDPEGFSWMPAGDPERFLGSLRAVQALKNKHIKFGQAQPLKSSPMAGILFDRRVDWKRVMDYESRKGPDAPAYQTREFRDRLFRDAFTGFAESAHLYLFTGGKGPEERANAFLDSVHLIRTTLAMLLSDWDMPDYFKTVLSDAEWSNVSQPVRDWLAMHVDARSLMMRDGMQELLKLRGKDLSQAAAFPVSKRFTGSAAHFAQESFFRSGQPDDGDGSSQGGGEGSPAIQIAGRVAGVISGYAAVFGFHWFYVAFMGGLPEFVTHTSQTFSTAIGDSVRNASEANRQVQLLDAVKNLREKTRERNKSIKNQVKKYVDDIKSNQEKEAQKELENIKNMETKVLEITGKATKTMAFLYDILLDKVASRYANEGLLNAIKKGQQFKDVLKIDNGEKVQPVALSENQKFAGQTLAKLKATDIDVALIEVIRDSILRSIREPGQLDFIWEPGNIAKYFDNHTLQGIAYLLENHPKASERLIFGKNVPEDSGKLEYFLRTSLEQDKNDLNTYAKDIRDALSAYKEPEPVTNTTDVSVTTAYTRQSDAHERGQNMSGAEDVSKEVANTAVFNTISEISQKAQNNATDAADFALQLTRLRESNRADLKKAKELTDIRGRTFLDAANQPLDDLVKVVEDTRSALLRDTTANSVAICKNVLDHLIYRLETAEGSDNIRQSGQAILKEAENKDYLNVVADRPTDNTRTARIDAIESLGVKAASISHRLTTNGLQEIIGIQGFEDAFFNLLKNYSGSAGKDWSEELVMFVTQEVTDTQLRDPIRRLGAGLNNVADPDQVTVTGNDSDTTFGIHIFPNKVGDLTKLEDLIDATGTLNDITVIVDWIQYPPGKKPNVYTEELPGVKSDTPFWKRAWHTTSRLTQVTASARMLETLSVLAGLWYTTPDQGDTANVAVNGSRPRTNSMSAKTSRAFNFDPSSRAKADNSEIAKSIAKGFVAAQEQAGRLRNYQIDRRDGFVSTAYKTYLGTVGDLGEGAPLAPLTLLSRRMRDAVRQGQAEYYDSIQSLLPRPLRRGGPLELVIPLTKLVAVVGPLLYGSISVSRYGLAFAAGAQNPIAGAAFALGNSFSDILTLIGSYLPSYDASVGADWVEALKISAWNLGIALGSVAGVFIIAALAYTFRQAISRAGQATASLGVRYFKNIIVAMFSGETVMNLFALATLNYYIEGSALDVVRLGAFTIYYSTFSLLVDQVLQPITNNMARKSEEDAKRYLDKRRLDIFGRLIITQAHDVRLSEHPFMKNLLKFVSDTTLSQQQVQIAEQNFNNIVRILDDGDAFSSGFVPQDYNEFYRAFFSEPQLRDYVLQTAKDEEQNDALSRKLLSIYLTNSKIYAESRAKVILSLASSQVLLRLMTNAAAYVSARTLAAYSVAIGEAGGVGRLMAQLDLNTDMLAESNFASLVSDMTDALSQGAGIISNATLSIQEPWESGKTKVIQAAIEDNLTGQAADLIKEYGSSGIFDVYQPLGGMTAVNTFFGKNFIPMGLFLFSAVAAYALWCSLDGRLRRRRR